MLVLYGGTGFIGRHICERAHSESHNAVTISRQPDMKFLNKWAPSVLACKAASNELGEYLKRARTVVYLANNSEPSTNAQAASDIISNDQNSLMRFTEGLFDINPTCRMIYLSSGGQIYGEGHTSPISEVSDPQPVTPYAVGKAQNEKSLNDFRASCGADIMILRLANPIGYWQIGTSHGFVSAAISACVNEHELKIFGEGHNVRDYFDVNDFAKFICALHVSDKATSGTFNIGSGTAKTELDIIEIIQNELRRKINVKHEKSRTFDLSYAVLDVTRASNDLGWKPQTTLSDSITTIANFITMSEAENNVD